MELVHRSRTKTARLRLYCIYCKEGSKKGNIDEIIMYLGIFIITSHTHTVGRDMEVRELIANTNYAVFRNTMYT